MPMAEEATPNSEALWTYKVTLEDVLRTYPPRPELTEYKAKHKGPVLALGRAVYETQPQEATDNLLRLVEVLSRNFAPGNLWLLPTYERLPYPYAVYWPLACAFRWEAGQKRRFDWFMWMDDDVLVTPKDVLALIDAAQKHGAPFIAGVPYDRFPPHCPSVTELDGQGKPWKWVKAPATGTYPCFTVGLCLALFHRSVFDMVPEPWFGAIPPSRAFSGVHPDWWWSYQMHSVGMHPFVCCDSAPIHLGRKTRISREVSEHSLDAREDWTEYPELAPGKRFASPETGAIMSPPRRDYDMRPEKIGMTERVQGKQ